MVTSIFVGTPYSLFPTLQWRQVTPPVWRSLPLGIRSQAVLALRHSSHRVADTFSSPSPTARVRGIRAYSPLAHPRPSCKEEPLVFHSFVDLFCQREEVQSQVQSELDVK